MAQLPAPIAFYPLDGNANDISGNNLNGSINGALPTLNRCGNPNSAFFFDGFSSSITIDFNPLFDIPPDGQFTISSWIRPISSSVNAIFVKCFLADPFTNGIWDYGQYAINSQLMAGAGAPGWVLLSNSFIPIEQCWTHYVFSYNNGIWKIYLNGALEDQDLTQSNFITQSNGGIAIGKKGESNGDFFHGSIDDVAFYNVELTPEQVLSLFDSQKVTFQPESNNLSICQGASLALGISSSCSTFQPSFIQWTPSESLSANNIINPIANPIVSTTYLSEITIEQCPFESTINVEVINLSVDLGPDASYCSGESFQLNAQNAGANYSWQDGSSNQTFNTSSSGIFWVDVTINNCTQRDSITINIIPQPTLDIGNDTTICEASTLLLTAEAPGYNIVWQDGSTNEDFLVTNSGIYFVTASLDACSYIDSISINTIAAPNLIIIGDNQLCENEIIQLFASSSNGNLLWNNGSTEESISIGEAGTYSVILTSACGESDASVEVVSVDCNDNIYIPNAFTPDGDNVNDIFKAISQNILSFEMSVYNRYGQLVYYTNDILEGWNGSTLNGSYYCPDGIYIFSYKAKFDETKIREGKGHVMLLR